MDPQNYSYPPVPQNTNQPKKRLGFIAIVAVVIVIVLGAILFLKPHQPATSSTKFGINTITPSQTSVTTQTTTMAIKFNRSLAIGSATVVASPNIIAATNISGDALNLAFKPRTLIAQKTYTITIKNLSSSSGDQLATQQLSFAPSFAPPTTTGQDTLTDVGLSDDQVISIMNYISQFDPWAKTVTIDDATLRHFKLNPTDAWSPWAVGFTANIDGANYYIVGSYYDTEHIQLKVSDPVSGRQLFTAGTPGTI